MKDELRKMIKYFSTIPIVKSDREDFYYKIQRMNMHRGCITSASFFVMEFIVLIASIIVKKKEMFKTPHIYYLMMYLLILIMMPIFLYVFHQQHKFGRFSKRIEVASVLFAIFLLGWCAGISLLDLLANYKTFTYSLAILAVGLFPVYRPYQVFITYIVVQIFFLDLLPQIDVSGDDIFIKAVNSSTLIILSFSISYIRYRKLAEDYFNNKRLRESAEELKHLNMELEEANHKLEILSQRDGLTGIYTRPVFNKIIDREWQSCINKNQLISLMIIDIDYFGPFNENYGYQTGDICLKQITEVISACIDQNTDQLIRYGGDEFAIILPIIGNMESIQLAEMMRCGVEQLKIPNAFSSASDHITISIGLHTTLPLENISVEEFVFAAELALKDAKCKNRNKVIVS